MKVEIWSDVVCPWCYIGKRRFEAALARFPRADDVEVQWRSFQLDPDATSAPPGSHAQHLSSKYGVSLAKAQEMLDSMTATAAAEGLDFHFDRSVQANTFDAHQLIHLGQERGVQAAVKERLLRAYFTDGEDVSDRSTLVRLGESAGLDPEEVRSALADQTYAAAVRSDEQEARALGITAVPFFVLDRTYGIPGAQPPEQIVAALEEAWPNLKSLGVGAGDSCGPEGCAV
jgi:predicted DsbA family dithiol-disulfide isomerase